MSLSQTLSTPPVDSLERLRAEIIALIQVAPAEAVQEIADLLQPNDPLREGNAADETVVGYAGERAVTMGDLRDRARGADAAIVRGEYYTGEEVRERLRQKFMSE